jgi:2-methylfumaryl-CoA hydratase
MATGVETRTSGGRFFEDFAVGQALVHATPRTITIGDVALSNALYGSRFVVQSSETFAQAVGYQTSPVDDLLVFHMVFGKSVADVSLNAVANLGYAQGRFLAAVHPGDTLSATSRVIGLKENSSGGTGTVYVNTVGSNQHGVPILDYVRWVMVRKRDKASRTLQVSVPTLPDRVDPSTLGAAVPQLDPSRWDVALSGSPHRWADYRVGERIDHVDGMTIEEAEHQLATRLYQNTARVHFNAHAERAGRFAKRIVYGGHVISIARALSFNGLANAWHVAAINGGRHVAPCFAGDTVYAWSEVLETAEANGRSDIGFLRVRTIATKDKPGGTFPALKGGGFYEEGVVLDFDYWLALPR